MTSSRWMLLSGIFLLIGGAIGIVAPLAVSLAATLFVGWFFLIQGAMGLYAAFMDPKDRLWQAAMGILGLLLGMSFVANPLSGVLSLTLLVGIMLAASGVIRLWMAYGGAFPVPRWVLIFGGLASLLLGMVMMFGIFGSGAAVLGLLISLEMLMMGSALVAMGWNSPAPGEGA